MQLQILSKNDMPLSPTIEQYVTRRIGKMDRYLPSIDQGKVEISREEAKQPDQRFIVQVTLDSNGTLIRAQERADDVRTAIDRVVDALANRIARYKGRRFAKGKDSLRTMEAVPQQPEVAPAEPHRVVKTKRFTLKPMPLDEATEQMELLGHDFFLFVDSDTGKANLLYRRKDGDYGLIEPNS
ncbi:MAG: ribosome-associated translation inhibitor RaiA [Dehalococcoidia bacterium]|jgi:putative sigma-54 modulation protein|nr:ribosome-associated translation inhibitor RaiA [Dehalococcoidia bacterium]